MTINPGHHYHENNDEEDLVAALSGFGAVNEKAAESHDTFVEEMEREYSSSVDAPLEVQDSLALLLAGSTPEPEAIIIELKTDQFKDLVVTLSEEGRWAQLALVPKRWKDDGPPSGAWAELSGPAIAALMQALVQARAVLPD
jgi:hypothetical protein